MDQEWEGPVPAALSGVATRAAQAAGRPPVWVECRCGHEWQSRAKDRMTIKCPECGTGQRVPRRMYDNTGPAPAGRPAPALRSSRPRPAPAWEPDDEWEPQAPEQPSVASWRPSAPARTFTRPTGLGGLAAVLGAALGVQIPAPAPAAPPRARPTVPNPPAVSPAARPRVVGAIVEPLDQLAMDALPERERKRRDSVCQISRALSASVMVWYNQPRGLCEALDLTQPSDFRRCPAAATHAVRFRQDVTEADAYVCPAHARPLADTAALSPYITAQIYGLR